MESEFDLLREENARLMAKITELEFEKAGLEARNALFSSHAQKKDKKEIKTSKIFFAELICFFFTPQINRSRGRRKSRKIRREAVQNVVIKNLS
jgi:hypothetical protein